MEAQMRYAIAIILLTAPLAHAAAPPVEWKLTAEDRKFLDSLFAFLVSPVGAQRVEVPAVTKWTGVTKKPLTSHAWHLPGPRGKPGRFVSPDGGIYRTNGKAKPVDFVVACRERLAKIEKAKRRRLP